MKDAPYVKGSSAEKYKWHEIKDPKSWNRVYTYMGGAQLSVEGARWVYAKKDGGHRLFTESGKSIYVMPGWISVEWKGKESLNSNGRTMCNMRSYRCAGKNPERFSCPRRV